MKLTCPSCGATNSLEAAVSDKAARQVAALFGRLPPEVAAVVPEYLALFRPAKTGLRWSRVATVLEELVPMVVGGFRTGGRTCKAPAAYWREAIQQVANRDLTRPLANHNYLKRVVAGLTEQHAAEAEVQHHQAMREGHRPRRESSQQVAHTPSHEDQLMQALGEVWRRYDAGEIDDSQRDAALAEIHSKR